MTAYSFSSGKPGIFSARAEASDADFLYTTERYEVGKTVFGGEEAGIDSGTYQHAAVGKDAHTLVGRATEMVEEVATRAYNCGKLSPLVAAKCM